MKNITFDSRLLAAYIDFCAKCKLKIVSQTIAGTMQDAYCDIVVEGEYNYTLSEAEDNCILFDDKLLTIYGAFNNTAHGKSMLTKAIEQYNCDKKQKMQSISELLKPIS